MGKSQRPQNSCPLLADVGPCLNPPLLTCALASLPQEEAKKCLSILLTRSDRKRIYHTRLSTALPPSLPLQAPPFPPSAVSALCVAGTLQPPPFGASFSASSPPLLGASFDSSYQRNQSRCLDPHRPRPKWRLQRRASTPASNNPPGTLNCAGICQLCWPKGLTDAIRHLASSLTSSFFRRCGQLSDSTRPWFVLAASSFRLILGCASRDPRPASFMMAWGVPAALMGKICISFVFGHYVNDPLSSASFFAGCSWPRFVVSLVFGRLNHNQLTAFSLATKATIHKLSHCWLRWTGSAITLSIWP